MNVFSVNSGRAEVPRGRTPCNFFAFWVRGEGRGRVSVTVMVKGEGLGLG